MMATQSLIIALSCVAAACGCSRADSSRPVVIATHENGKYGLVCTFYGNEVMLDNGKTVEVVSNVTIGDERRAKEVPYMPSDPVSLNEPGGFFPTVWSPDDELLVLPLGRFDGFAIIKADEALQRVAERNYTDFVRVHLDTGARLWHEFQRWDGPTRFTIDM